MNYRRIVLPALVFLALLGGSVGRAAEPAASTAQVFLPLVMQADSNGLSASEQAVLDAVNTERKAVGCPALSVSPALQAAARKQANGMATRDYFSHIDPDGNDTTDRAEAAGYVGALIGENIAIGQPTAQAVMYSQQGWMNSQAHRTNILRCTFTETGIAYAFDANDQFKVSVNGRLVGPFYHYWAQVFGAPKS